MHERAEPANEVLRVLEGRSLAFSPEWREDGASVLFDRNSGDYWVVSTFARRLVEELVHGERLDARALVDRTLAVFPDEFDMTPETGARVLQELLQLGILVAATGRSGRTDRDTPLA